ncbi:MAG: CHASE2 domain-containing protein [Dechloromonas sp.]|nr:CHASE2 domain-containing protein [Dechloromonas sp.]
MSNKALLRRILLAGRGRLVPLLLLLLAALALHYLPHTPLISLQQSQFDRYQRLLPRARDQEPVIVVGIDSQSLLDHGPWPWPRSLLAQLIDRIQAGQPLALGLDLIFAEPDQYSRQTLGQRLPSLSPQVLQHLPDNDQQLAKRLARSPTTLAVVGLNNKLPGSRPPAHPLPMFQQDVRSEQALPRFATALVSRPELQHAASGEGFINGTQEENNQANTERGVLRRVPTLAYINKQPFLSLPLDMVRQALGNGEVVAEHDDAGMNAIWIGDYRLPTQANGELLLHYGQANSHYYLSASDVLAGRHPPETFTSRFVLIGFNSTGLQDRVITPLGDSLPGIDIHAQVIESLLMGAALKRPHWMPHFELLTLLLAGLLLISAVPVLPPKRAVFAFAGVSSLLIGGGYLAFLSGHWLYDGPSQSLLLSPLFISLLGNTLIAADTRRREAERQLQHSREEAARMAGELDAARRIQMGLLPAPRELFAQENRFAMAALLEPARAVGGDYFDCFMLDSQRLCFAIGDVSGKGLPASLFMSISKTLTSTLIPRHTDLGMAVRDIEVELSRQNSEYLFVTAFIAILDVDRGELEFVCAGHDAPLILRQGRIKKIDTAAISGPPLCALGDYPYTAGSAQLTAGDLLCLYTDGVTEASNGDSMFGNEGLADALHHQLGVSNIEQATDALRATVRRFEAGLPPADDLTLMLLRWDGPPPPAQSI